MKFALGLVQGPTGNIVRKFSDGRVFYEPNASNSMKISVLKTELLK